MFIQTDIREFINKIINQSDLREKEQVKVNITKFREYLRLTCMADEATLSDIDLIIECIDELMVLKNKFGRVDVENLFEEREEEKERVATLKKTPQSRYDHKHYRHYSGGVSSSCGSTPSRSSSCGSTPVERNSSPSYSSGCGNSGPTYRSC